MTSRPDDLSDELRAIASAQIGRGAWPWSFYCYLEDTPRPVTPSAFRFLVPCAEALGMAACCPACGSTSVNLVTLVPRRRAVPLGRPRRCGGPRVLGRRAPDDRRLQRRARLDELRRAAAAARWLTTGARSLPGGIITRHRAGRSIGMWTQPSTTKHTDTTRQRPPPVARLPRTRQAGAPPAAREGAPRGGPRPGARAQAALQPLRSETPVTPSESRARP